MTLIAAFVVFITIIVILDESAKAAANMLDGNKRNGRKRKNSRAKRSNPAQTNLFGQVVYFVYLLKDGRKVFYVGQTDNPDRRYNEHMASAKKSKRPVYKYIRKMLRWGREPHMVIVESSTDKEAIDKLERKYVKRYNKSVTNVLLR